MPETPLEHHAAAVVRRIPDVSRDVTVWTELHYGAEWSPIQGTIDRADFQRIVGDVLATVNEMLPGLGLPGALDAATRRR